MDMDVNNKCDFFEGEDKDPEKGFDELVEYIRPLLKGQEDRVIMETIDPDKVKDLNYVYRLIKRAVKGDNLKITKDYYCHDMLPCPMGGSVIVVGKNIIIDKPNIIVEALECAANCELLLTSDGAVAMEFDIHGLTKPLN